MLIKSLKELRYYIRSDAYRYIGGGNCLKICSLRYSTIGFRYTYWMRVCAYLRHSALLYPLYLIAHFHLKRLSYKSGIQIPYFTEIGPGFYIGHFGTIVINGEAKLGKNVNISPGVNIGMANRGANKGVPVFGNEVYIGPGAKIIGRINIGNNVAIGANAVVTKDIPDNACVGGVPAKVLSMDGTESYVNNKI